jgi:hypothetical protein
MEKVCQGNAFMGLSGKTRTFLKDGRREKRQRV